MRNSLKGWRTLGVLAVIMCVAMLSSCNNDDDVFPAPIEESSMELSEEFSANLSASLSLRSNGVSSWDLTNWDVASTIFGDGVSCIKRKNDNSYVVIANLKTGAKVGMVYDTPSNRGMSNARFPKKSLSTWNNYGNFFAIANSLYFDTSSGNPCDFPFPFKQGWTMESLGDGGSDADRKKEKAVLNIFSNYADIVKIGTDPMNTSLMNGLDKSYSGFWGSATNANSATSSCGRTLVGLRDSDSDGKLEVLFLLVCSSKTQKEAYNILIGEFGCAKVLTFDGGGSSQLLCKGVERIISSDYQLSGKRRDIPIAIVIKEKGVNWFILYFCKRGVYVPPFFLDIIEERITINHKFIYNNAY